MASRSHYLRHFLLFAIPNIVRADLGREMIGDAVIKRSDLLIANLAAFLTPFIASSIFSSHYFSGIFAWLARGKVR